MTTRYGHKSPSGVQEVQEVPRVQGVQGVQGLWLRYAAMVVLMMIVGVSEVLGQEISDGLYYIANANQNSYSVNMDSSVKYYLCPTESWYNYLASSPHYIAYNSETDNGMPFMTTFQCRNGVYDDNKALWCIKCIETVDNTKYYNIIHVIDGKYLTYNGKMDNCNKEGRMRVHLEASPSDGDAALFAINYVENTFQSGPSCYDIVSKKDDNYKYLNVNDGNKNYLVANGKTDGPNGMATGGIIGLWTSGSNSDNNSKWFPESTLLPAPTISDVSQVNNKVKITNVPDWLPAGYKIRYTFSSDGTPDNPDASSPVLDVDANYDYLVTEAGTLKVVVEQHGVVLTEVSEPKYVEPLTVCAPPTFTYTHTGKTVTITSTWPTDATIYYTLNGADPTTTVSETNFQYSTPIVIPDNCNEVKAIAVRDGYTTSIVSSISRVAAPTFVFDDATQKVTISCATEGTSIYYTTDGTTPITDSPEYSGAINLTSSTTIKAIAMKEGYIYSNVVENAYTQTTAPTITFDQYTNTFTISSATGTTIHYTIDGPPPTAGSAPYSAAVSLTSAATINAIAVKSGEVYSSISSKVIGKSNTPVISYSGDDVITITTDPTGAEVYYTTSSTTPPSNTTGTPYDDSFTLTATQDVVQAIVYEADKVSSDIATYTVAFHLGSSKPYLLQNQYNGWTTGDHQGCHFYIIPGDVKDGVTMLNTSSLLRPSMEWYFLNAGVESDKQYYYIVNNVSGQRMCYVDSKMQVKTWDSENANKFKFSITSLEGSWTISPYGTTSYVNKASGNNNEAVINIDTGTNTGKSRWKFVRRSEVDDVAPFTESDNSNATYYKLQNVNNSSYIAPPTTFGGNAILSTTAANTLNWYFEVAQAPTTDDWLTYYYIRNAVTGDYLYYTGDNPHMDVPALETRSTYVNANKDRYLFTWARSATSADSYFIVPRMLRDEQLNKISSLYKKDMSIRINADRNANTCIWKFVAGDLTVAPPIIAFDADSHTFVITSTTPGATFYYTIDGGAPTESDYEFSGSTGVELTGTVVKAIAIKGGLSSDVTTLSVPVRVSTEVNRRPYLIQSLKNTNYYIIPVTDTGSTNGFTKMNTTTLGQPSMMWCFENAGNIGGVQYYYLVNKSTGQYVYYHSGDLISVNEGTTFNEIQTDIDLDPYRFSIDPANPAVGEGYNICPKNRTDRCIFKTASNKQNSYITANVKTDLLGCWDFISVPDEKMPATTPPVMVSTASAAKYYTLENEKLTGNYITPNTPVATTTSLTDDNEKWCFLQAAKDDWLTYYHIVNAENGEYLYLNNTGNNAVSTKALSEDTTNPDKYQFVLAPSSTGAFYIIPKSLATQNTREFTSLYYDGTNPLKTLSRRYWADSSDGDDAYIKWKIAEADLDFCKDPVFSEEGGKIILSCPTFGAEIHYTTDGNTPTSSTPTVFTDETSLLASSQYIVKAIAVFKNDPSDSSKDKVSNDATLFNKPDVTLSQDTYTYDRTAHEPTVSSVSIGVTTADAATYTIDSYANNTNAGTATVNLVDKDDTDNIFFSNFTKDFTITPVELTITAEAQTKGYGDPDPELTYLKSGIVSGDEWEDVLTGALTCNTGEGNLGTYPILNGLTPNSNYTINYTGADLTITTKSLGDGTNPAPNITYNLTKVGNNYNIVVKQGGSDLDLNTDYTNNAPTDGTKYYEATIAGQGNYSGSFIAKYAKVNFSRRVGGSSTDWAGTFVTNATGDADYAVPANMRAYIITGISGNAVIVEELDYIPEYVPVLLMSPDDANGFMVQSRDGGETITSGQRDANLLKVDATNKVLTAAQVYLLYGGEFVLNAAGTLPAGKIYLPRSSSAPAPVKLYIDWDFVDGIGEQWTMDNGQWTMDNGQLIMDNEEYYTLDGIKLSGKPARKGMYLQNGKKVIIR